MSLRAALGGEAISGFLPKANPSSGGKEGLPRPRQESWRVLAMT